jgi:peptidoglycan/LPS O-acetylase OafA/YrhL
MESLSTQPRIVLPSYIPQFDGLRGIAILAVFVAHSEFLRNLPHASVLQYGRFGVDLFFVLSGFLITGILLDSRDSPHYFRNFYMRRALRIWPLYYLFLATAFIGGPIPFPAIRGISSRQWLYFVLYVQNLPLHFNIPQALDLTWSLAVEEQYYMTWPLLVFLLPRRMLRWALFSAIGLSIALRIAGFALHARLEFIHQFTPSQLDTLAFGCLAALYLRSPACTAEAWRRWSVRALVIGACGMAMCRFLWSDQSTVISYTFIGAGFAGLLGISLVLDTTRSWFGRLITSRWLCFTGKISYGLYLVHLPLFLVWRKIVFDRNLPFQGSVIGNLTSAAIEFAGAFVLATLSWRLFESQVLRLKKYFPSGSALHRPVEEPKAKAEKLLPNRDAV